MESVAPIVRQNISHETRLMTDDSRLYSKVGRDFAEHVSVKHSAGEYVREDAYTNTVEGYLSIFKRGFKGIYQHCAEHHLHRYLAEYHSRYNNRVRLGVSDYGRTGNAFKGIFGKRLTYRQSSDL